MNQNLSKKNILVGQSGGPTAVINASLYGIVCEGKKHPEAVEHVYGMINGIEGFLSGRCLNLSQDLSEQELELLKLTPAAYLGSCRYKLPDDLSANIYPTLMEKLVRMNIGYFLYIGGNDSMDTVSKLSRYASNSKIDIKFIGIPKTIDNDLVLTDHTPGYGSAAKYVASTVREIVLDSIIYQKPSITIVELMGRHAGWLTASSILARKTPDDNPVLIYLPEVPFSMEQFISDLEAAFKRHSSLVVCVSEGIVDKNGTFICEYADEVQIDTFGHKMLTGCGKILENFVRNHFHVKVRSVEVNVIQRCSGMLASETDIEEASWSGAEGVQAALQSITGKMVTFQRESDATGYKITSSLEDVNEICNKEKTIPLHWITDKGTNLGPEFIEYITPLIQGEPKRLMEDGLPLYTYRK